MFFNVKIGENPLFPPLAAIIPPLKSAILPTFADGFETIASRHTIKIVC